jgi:hypothetical protein
VLKTGSDLGDVLALILSDEAAMFREYSGLHFFDRPHVTDTHLSAEESTSMSERCWDIALNDDQGDPAQLYSWDTKLETALARSEREMHVGCTATLDDELAGTPNGGQEETDQSGSRDQLLLTGLSELCPGDDTRSASETSPCDTQDLEKILFGVQRSSSLGEHHLID